MIILTLGGGLGNQMFQYAFARKLQIEIGDDSMRFTGFRLKDTGIDDKVLYRLNIPEGISFSAEEEDAELERQQDDIIRRIQVKRKLGKIFPRITERYLEKISAEGIYTTCSVYDKQPFKRSDAPVKYVFGGFQTHRYWEDMIPQMRSELRVKSEPPEANRRIIEEMQSCESVCVHMRRGDYLDPEFAHLNVCNEQYYMTAMRRLKEQKPDAVFYIFSNDHKEIEWIRAHYDFTGYEVRYVDMNNVDYEELRLMYHCKNFIISNSTYSWWGQLLSDASDKIVMAPSIWNREMKADGIYMDDWQIIDVR
jgi:hypothetical protein